MSCLESFGKEGLVVRETEIISKEDGLIFFIKMKNYYPESGDCLCQLDRKRLVTLRDQLNEALAAMPRQG